MKKEKEAEEYLKFSFLLRLMIIGITGLPCSGADTFGKILVEKGFIQLSYSDVLREEARKRGIEITRDSLRELGNELRKKEGKGVISKRLIEKIENGKNYVVTTIRNPGEIREFRKNKGKEFILVNIDAPDIIRFERMVKRGRENDPNSFEEFKKLEKIELGKGQKAHGLQIRKCMEMADKVIVNDGSLDDLRKKIEEILRELKEK